LNISFGNKTEEKVIEHNNNPEAVEIADSQNFTKRKILCQVWATLNGRDTMIIKPKKVKYGSKYFKVKIAGKMHRFKIIYDSKVGAMKQGNRYFVYDVHFNNALGALSFHEYTEKVDSRHADTMAVDDAVNFFINKGGMPFWWLLIAILGMVVCAGGLGIIAPQYAQQSDLVQQLIKQHNTDQASLQTLEQQVHSLGGK